MMNNHAVDLSLLAPAWAAGLLVLLTHVPLGTKVLARGIVFIDLAIAQIASLGAVLALALEWPQTGLGVQILAAGAALLGAALLTWTEKKAPEQQEAIIGVVFVLAACTSVLLVNSNPHGGERLKEMLVGQILWVSRTQLVWLAALTAVLLLAMRSTWLQKTGRFGFYATFALAVTASVQLVGVYLVFCSLIVPALATRHHCPGRRRHVWAYAMGALGYTLGLGFSAALDWPSGPTIVWALVLCAGALGLIAVRSTPHTQN
jgi:zinc/manganese transport system permease protein